jgi:RND family efflux transporter MFP subunit
MLIPTRKFLIALILLLGLAAAPALAQEDIAQVGVDAVIVEPLAQTAPVIGRLVTTQAGTVAARINGAVDSVRVEVGDRVAKGDVLVVLVKNRMLALLDEIAADVEATYAAVEIATADAALAGQELDRLEALRAKESAAFSQARYDDARQAVAAANGALTEAEAGRIRAQASLRVAEIDLYNMEVRAPYDGVVTEKRTAAGEYVNVGNAVVALVNVNRLEIEADVPTERVGGLAPGLSVEFEVAGAGGYRAEVRAIVPEEDALTRTRPVRFVPDFGVDAGHFAANQSVTLILPVRQSDTVVTVHKDAVIHGEDGRYVYFVAKDSLGRPQAEPRPVVLGTTLGGRFEVISGLGDGDLVVIRGNERLYPFQKIGFDGADMGRQLPATVD